MNNTEVLKAEIRRLKKEVSDLKSQHQGDLAEIIRLRRLCEALEEGEIKS